MKKITLLLFIILPTLLFAQVGIGTTTPGASTILQLDATNKGFLPPRVTLTATTDGTTISSPASGLLVYNTASVSNVTPGYYFYNGANWVRISDLLSIVGGTQFANSMILGHTTTGTLSAASLNTAIGSGAMKTITQGDNNTAVGYNSLSTIAAARDNTAVGTWASEKTTGDRNTAIGTGALAKATSVFDNVAIGQNTILNNNWGIKNVAVGNSALTNLSGTLAGDSEGNTAIGHLAGGVITTGKYNTFLGYDTKASLATVANATAIGNGAIVAANNTIQLGNMAVTDVKTSATITAKGIIITSSAPTSSTDTGILGEIRVDGSYVYVYSGTAWVRAALSTYFKVINMSTTSTKRHLQITPSNKHHHHKYILAILFSQCGKP
jgi:hypothetical protein